MACGAILDLSVETVLEGIILAEEEDASMNEGPSMIETIMPEEAMVLLGAQVTIIIAFTVASLDTLNKNAGRRNLINGLVQVHHPLNRPW